jgi:putrescine transport system permease protein
MKQTLLKPTSNFASWISRICVLGLPLGWLALFTLVPCLIVFAISLTTARIGVPPYTPLLTKGEGVLPRIDATADNYKSLLADPLYLAAVLNSIRIAAVSSFLTLCLAFPMAYAIARAKETLRPPLLSMVALPFWTSFLIRVYAWTSILNSNGIVNTALLKLGVITEPLALLHTEFAIHLGIVYSYLPFMVLPIYAVLEQLDWTLFEAAQDLGARPLRVFWRVTLPLSWRGIAAGLLLVFIPAAGEFIIPDLLGGPDTLMIGQLLWTEFFNNHDWPQASALAIVLLILVLMPAMVIFKLRRRIEAPS